MAKRQETICVHNAGDYKGANTPIFPSTSNKYIGYDDNTYPRYFNTTNQQVIVEMLCKLEKGEAGMVFSSGMAAISSTLMSLLKPGDHVLVSSGIYGGTHKLIVEEFKKFGIAFDFVTGHDPKDFVAKITPQTKIIYTETPSNPLLTIMDLREIVKLAKSNGLISIVDNTFATPINQRPLEMGFDVVLHSGTKYLGGHSDLCFGAMISSEEIKQEVYKHSLSFGGSLNALDCYLIERSLKTLAIRVKQHNVNAQTVAEFLHNCPEIDQVYYPGLPSHQLHDVAKSQMDGFGGMLAFTLSDEKDADQFLANLKVIIPSLSLGGVESIICQPSITSHLKMPEEERIKQGITDSLLRLSVGIEHVDDLIADIQQALR